MSTKVRFHFKVVGDDDIGKKTIVEQYASGKDVPVVKGVMVNVKLSLYTDATEGTVSSDLLEPNSQSVSGYIFVYNVSDLESFTRLNMWLAQIDTYGLQNVSIVQEPKILLGNVLKGEDRAIEFERALKFAQSVNMTYIEADVENDSLEIERAILMLVKEKLPPSLLLGSSSGNKKIAFKRKRTATVADTQEASRMLAPSHYRRSSSPTPGISSEPKQNKEELSILTAVMMSLNMSVARLSFSLKKRDVDDTPVTTDEKPSAWKSPLGRLIQVAVEAEKCVKAAQTKFDSYDIAKDETLVALKQQLEGKHEQIDELCQENRQLVTERSNLEQQLEEVSTQYKNSQMLVDKLKQDLQASKGGDSNHWKVDKTEIEMCSKTLGTGGYATVSIAKFRGLEVAAKRLYGIILNSYNREMFKREMNIAARIRHPNLVQFMGAVVDEEPIILMELMPTTLREVLPKELNKLTQEQIQPICKDIARALAYLHSMKPEPIIHRDISSANVLLEPAADSMWKAKVSDYGSANFFSMINTIAPGNAVYAAPEAEFPKQQSPKMDVFSFGVLVIEMYLREFPDPNSRDQMVYEVGILYPSVLPMIEGCLHHNPSDRLCMLDILESLN